MPSKQLPSHCFIAWGGNLTSTFESGSRMQHSDLFPLSNPAFPLGPRIQASVIGAWVQIAEFGL